MGSSPRNNSLMKTNRSFTPIAFRSSFTGDPFKVEPSSAGFTCLEFVVDGGIAASNQVIDFPVIWADGTGWEFPPADHPHPGLMAIGNYRSCLGTGFFFNLLRNGFLSE